MGKAPQNTVLACLRIIMKPIMRFCLRHSLRIQDVLEAAKIALIDVAREDIEAAGQKVNVSRLSVTTGLHRRDVMRIYRDEDIISEPQGMISRIIGQWQSDKRFTTKAKKPRVLTADGDNSEFYKLIRLVSNDVHPGTVMFELERGGIIERVPRGVRLAVSAYVPKNDPEEGFILLAQDTEDLIDAVEENIFKPQDVPNLHVRTEYDRISEDAVPKIRDWLLAEGSAFHARARKFISQYDLDINPKAKGKDRPVKVSLGSFSKLTQSDEERN